MFDRLFRRRGHAARPAARFVPRLEVLDGRVVPGHVGGGNGGEFFADRAAVYVMHIGEEIPQTLAVSHVGDEAPIGSQMEPFGGRIGIGGEV